MNHPLRFCMITTFYPPYSFGGDAIYVQQLANALAARGHHVEVIHCIDSYRLLANGETLRAEQDEPGVIVHRLESPFGALSPLATQQTGYPFFKTVAIRKILEQGFDVIHYHNISLVGGPKLLEIGDAVKLYTTHEYWLVCPMSVLFRYDGVACEEKRCMRCTLAFQRPPQWWRYTNMMNEAIKHIDMLIHPSPFSMQKHRELGLNAPGTVMYYLQTLEPARADTAPLANASPYFLYVGRLEALKGVHTLLPLFRDYPRARLVIVGEGSQLAELRKMAGGSTNIEFTGWMAHNDLAQYYRNATALIIPSLCFEGGPLVIPEAYLNHTPVIGRHIGALPDLLLDTGGGLTYQEDSELRGILDELLDNPARRHELGDRGYQASQKLFTTEAHLARYFQIIESVMERKKT